MKEAAGGLEEDGDKDRYQRKIVISPGLVMYELDGTSSTA